MKKHYNKAMVRALTLEAEELILASSVAQESQIASSGQKTESVDFTAEEGFVQEWGTNFE